jgi:hypothetical protein
VKGGLMTIGETVRKAGYELAISLFEELKGKEFLNSLNFKSLMDLCEAITDESSDRAHLEEILGRLINKAQIFNEYFQISNLFFQV